MCPECEYYYTLGSMGDEITLPPEDEFDLDTDYNYRTCDHCHNVQSFIEYYDEGEYDD